MHPVRLGDIKIFEALCDWNSSIGRCSNFFKIECCRAGGGCLMIAIFCGFFGRQPRGRANFRLVQRANVLLMHNVLFERKWTVLLFP